MQTMHPSITRGNFVPQQCTTCCTLYHCPICPGLRPMRLRRIRHHLDGHFKNAVIFEDKRICRCHLPCRSEGHYHCLFCMKTILRRNNIEWHLKICSKSASEPSHSLTVPAQEPSHNQPVPAQEPSQTNVLGSQSCFKKRKTTKCPLCSLDLLKKNFGTHILRKHTDRSQDVTVMSHPSICADDTGTECSTSANKTGAYLGGGDMASDDERKDWHYRAGVSMSASAPTATFSIQPPESFDFSKPHGWIKWIQRFERFRQASNLSASSEENQANTLIYCMGDEAEDVLRGLKLSDEDQKVYTKVKDGFHNFFVVRKSVVYERAQFNMRKQEAHETVDAFVTALYALAEHCNYGPLRDELIRDRIVVGLGDARLSERMQMENDLDLEKAINMARQSEEIKRQQNTLGTEASSAMRMDVSSIDGLGTNRQKNEKLSYTIKENSGARSHQPAQYKSKDTELPVLQMWRATPSMNVVPVLLSVVPVEKKVFSSESVETKPQ